MRDRQDAVFEIDLAPAQGRRLTPPKSGQCQNGDQRAVAAMLAGVLLPHPQDFVGFMGRERPLTPFAPTAGFVRDGRLNHPQRLVEPAGIVVRREDIGHLR
jgi:hypothetical protein